MRSATGARSQSLPKSATPSSDVAMGGTNWSPIPDCKKAGGLRQRPPLERLLDHRLQSVSTFVSSADSIAGALTERSAQSRKASVAAEAPAAILFPAHKPSSRADALVLDRWITGALEQYAEHSASSEASRGGPDEDKNHLTSAIEHLVPILSIGLNEVVRQVTHQCFQRGLVLEKIWRTYVDLFERALAETRALLRRHKERTQRVEAELERTRGELSDLQRRHPEILQKLSTTLAGKFTLRQEELDQQLAHIRQENHVLEQHLKEHGAKVESWFPLFLHYKDSEYRAQVLNLGPALPSSMTPEARIAGDFKRILGALPVDARRRVGFFVSSLLGLRGNQIIDLGSDTIEGLQQRKEHNQGKIDQLEVQMANLSSLLATSKDLSHNDLEAPLPTVAAAPDPL